jgi:GNAT superfamily N-acetyltransferase
MPSHIDEFQVVEVVDERTTSAEEALQLLAATFPPYDRHSLDDLRTEVAEKRYDLLFPDDFHLLALVDESDHVVATCMGAYLAGVNAGFVGYLAVHPEHRGQAHGRRLRTTLVELFKSDAIEAGNHSLAWVIGEVRVANPWLHKLVREGTAIPFDFDYYHPGMTIGQGEKYVLYRQLVGDLRRELAAAETRAILYAIYRRAYRVRYPLQHTNFMSMLGQIGERKVVGPHPEVVRLARAGRKPRPKSERTKSPRS